MKQTKSKNWVAVIPAAVLYNEKLSDKDKLVYCVVSNLTHEKGFCWASNRYIAELLGCSPVTVSRSISKLDKIGLIKNTLEKGSEGTLRRIYLPLSQVSKGFIKNAKPVSRKRGTNNIVDVNSNESNYSNELLTWINNKYKRKFTVLNEKKLKMRLKKFGLEKIKLAIDNAYADDFHAKNNFKYLTPEYFLRNDDNLDKWLNVKKDDNEQKTNNRKASNYAKNIASEFGW